MNRRHFLRNGLWLAAAPALLIPRSIAQNRLGPSRIGPGKIGSIAAAAGGKASFSDNFNRGDGALGANWTAAFGTITIATNQASSAQTFDNTDRSAAYTGTACTTADQYVKVTMGNGGGVCRPGALFRYTDNSSPCYEIRMDIPSQQMEWIRLATPGGAETQIDAPAFGTTVTFPATFGIIVKGTGNATVINCWINPATNAPDVGGATWNGNIADFQSIADPASPVDTGSYVGIGGIGSGCALTWDDFFGGDVP